MSDVYNNVLELIGNTPLIKLNHITKKFKGTFCAKLECWNPGHSVKDRIALHIIEDSERKGLLKPGATLVETTSGNTGFGLAMVALIKGYRCVLAVSDKTGADKIAYLRAIGAIVYVCPNEVPADDPRSYYEVAKKIVTETPNSFYVNQYFNKENTNAHYLTTGPEIWRQTKGKITHLIAASATGGTISGTARYLKDQNPNIKIIGVDAYGSVLKKYHETGIVDPDEIYSYRIEGMGKNFPPLTTDFSLIDTFIKVDDESAALRARQIAIEEALMVGYTSGAAMEATLQIAENLDENSLVVTIFPDHGSRYINKVYSDKWMAEQNFMKDNHYQNQKTQKT